MESGCARFLSAVEVLRRGGVVGGVSNVSSEEELCSSFADLSAFRASAAWIGTADEVSMASALTMSSTISQSG